MCGILQIILKLIAFRLKYFTHKFEVFDGTIVFLSYLLDLASLYVHILASVSKFSKGMCQYIRAKLKNFLEMEQSNRAQCKNAIKFPLS